MDKQNLHDNTVEKMYCEKYELIKLQNAVGQFVCPFCRTGENE
jgi:hypothetical protein